MVYYGNPANERFSSSDFVDLKGIDRLAPLPGGRARDSAGATLTEVLRQTSAPGRFGKGHSEY